MSDLISRSGLVKVLKDRATNEAIMVYMTAYDVINSIIDEVEEQTTAYDIDKVVEELKVIKEDALAEYNIGEYNLDNNIGNSIAENYRKDMNEGKCFAYDEAIEIVKHGGASDDVCEWKQTSTAKYKTNCGYKLEEFFDTNACFCKQCGRKIKVV